MASSSEKFFIQNLADKFQTAVKEVQDFIYKLPQSSDPKEICEPASKALTNLRGMIREEDQPIWLHNSIIYFNNIENCTISQQVNEAVFKIVTDIYPAMRSYEWDFSKSSTLEYDFDKIFQQHRDEQKIPELFDQIAEWLEKIIQSGEIDSIKVSNQLNQIIQTLRRSKNGSYFATLGAWNLTTTWLKNTGWELFGDIPIVGAFVRGLRETLKEARDSMNLMHEEIQKDLEANVLSDFPKLEYHSPDLPKIESDVDTNNAEIIIDIEQETED